MVYSAFDATVSEQDCWREIEMFHAISFLIVRFTVYLQYIPIRFRLQAAIGRSDLRDITMHGLSVRVVYYQCKRKPPRRKSLRRRKFFDLGKKSLPFANEWAIIANRKGDPG